MEQISVPNAEKVIRLAWHPTKDLLALGTFDREVLVWSVPDQTVVSSRSATGTLNSFAWSPDGNELAIGAGDETITIWNPTNDTARALVGHEPASPLELQLDWASTGVLVTIGWDSQIKTWDLSTETITHQFDGYVEPREIAWSPDGTLLACANYDDSILVWDPASEELVASLEAYDASPSSLAWSPDGGRLAIAGTVLLLWDPGADTETIISDGIESPPAVAWSPDGSFLATAEYGKTRVWDVVTSAAVEEFPGFYSDGNTIDWSADGSKLAFAGMSGPHLWNRT